MNARTWRAREDERLRALYPDVSTKEVARILRRSLFGIYGHANNLGLKKSAAYMASPAACRLRRGDNVGAAYRFKPGHVPANKGVKGWQAGGRSAETQFKQGRRPHTWKPIGTVLPDAYGYLRKKMTDTGYPPRDWVGVHILLWQEAHGPVPPGHCLRFKDGNKQNIRLENLEVVSRGENMRRNSIHRYPPELKKTIRAAGKLRRTLRRKTDGKEQTEGPPGPPLRDHRGVERRREAYGD